MTKITFYSFQALCQYWRLWNVVCFQEFEKKKHESCVCYILKCLTQFFCFCFRFDPISCRVSHFRGWSIVCGSKKRCVHIVIFVTHDSKSRFHSYLFHLCDQKLCLCWPLHHVIYLFKLGYKMHLYTENFRWILLTHSDDEMKPINSLIWRVIICFLRRFHLRYWKVKV